MPTVASYQTWTELRGDQVFVSGCSEGLASTRHHVHGARNAGGTRSLALFWPKRAKGEPATSGKRARVLVLEVPQDTVDRADVHEPLSSGAADNAYTKCGVLSDCPRIEIGCYRQNTIQQLRAGVRDLCASSERRSPTLRAGRRSLRSELFVAFARGR